MYKLALECVNEEIQLSDFHERIYIGSRDVALKEFDYVRRIERYARSVGHAPFYTNVVLLTDDQNEGRWDSTDKQFPYVVDGESFPME